MVNDQEEWLEVIEYLKTNPSVMMQMLGERGRMFPGGRTKKMKNVEVKGNLYEEYMSRMMSDHGEIES
jgi:hypothetical protein